MSEQFVKERVNKDTFLKLMREFMDHVDNGSEEFSLSIKGESCPFPADLLSKSNLDIEYEKNQDKTELEITVEWRHETE